ncbi:hypothetical protein Taro_021581, partial [Colocasia esculenta]|nr:hypothetical protein [Colocasia esculenta]
MHVGTNHWALLVINIKEKEFHVYDSLRNKDRPDIPQYVEIQRTYIKGRDIDLGNWSLRYLDLCPQQGSGDDCIIFTCKYMECLARRTLKVSPSVRMTCQPCEQGSPSTPSKRTSMHKNVQR